MNKTKATGISICPNSGTVNIDLPHKTDAIVRIYNALGKLHDEKKVMNITTNK